MDEVKNVDRLGGEFKMAAMNWNLKVKMENGRAKI